MHSPVRIALALLLLAPLGYAAATGAGDAAYPRGASSNSARAIRTGECMEAPVVRLDYAVGFV